MKGKQKTEAEKAFRMALASWEASGYRAGQADAAYQLGKLIRDREARSEALPFLEKASVLYHGLGNLPQEVVVLNDLGTAHAALDGMDQALTFYERALVLARKIKRSQSDEGTLNNRGRLYSPWSESEKARTALPAALAIPNTLPDRLG